MEKRSIYHVGRKCGDADWNNGHHVCLYLVVELVKEAVSMGEEQ